VGTPLFTSDHILATTAVLGVLGAAYNRGSKYSKQKRKTKAVIAGRDKTALEQLAERQERTDRNVDKILDVLITPEVEPGWPKPAPRLVDQVAAHGEQLAEQGAMLTRLMPNGGDTDEPGDLLVKMARKAGVTEDTADDD
jgi:hypothetical protein